MAPVGETSGADAPAGMAEDLSAATGAAGSGKKGSYVPPALRGAGGGAGERMGGSKYGERDDFATLRVTNVSLSPDPPLLKMSFFANGYVFLPNRSQRWQRNQSCAICSSVSVVSPESSLPRTGKLVWPRVSPSSASQTTATLSRHATRWTDLVSSISFSGSSLPRRLSKTTKALVFSCCGMVRKMW